MNKELLKIIIDFLKLKGSQFYWIYRSEDDYTSYGFHESLNLVEDDFESEMFYGKKKGFPTVDFDSLRKATKKFSEQEKECIEIEKGVYFDANGWTIQFTSDKEGSSDLTGISLLIQFVKKYQLKIEPMILARFRDNLFRKSVRARKQYENIEKILESL